MRLFARSFALHLSAPQAVPTSTSSPLDPEIRLGRHGTREHPRRTPSGPGRSPHRRHGTDGHAFLFFPSSSSLSFFSPSSLSFFLSPSSTTSSSFSRRRYLGRYCSRRIDASRRRKCINVAASGTTDYSGCFAFRLRYAPSLDKSSAQSAASSTATARSSEIR